MRVMKIAAVSALAVALSACGYTAEQRAASGALIGAGAGALAGQALCGNTACTVVGAVAGGAGGAIIGGATAP